MKYQKILNDIILLKKRNISQAEMCEALGFSPQKISARAKRNTSFSTEEIKKINSFFDIDLFNIIDDVIITDNFDLLEIIIETVEEYFMDKKLFLNPKKKAELITTIYKFYLDEEINNVKKDNILHLCKLAS